MKKQIPIVIMLLLITSNVFAAEFCPTILRLTAPQVIGYDFDGSEIEIPVDVSGTPAGIIFCVFTKDMDADIGEVHNGYLGWHHVNKVDTCIFYSLLNSVGRGENIFDWDGRDQDGGIVPPGTYTYYLWAFDNQGDFQQVTADFLPEDKLWAKKTDIIEYDGDGLPLAQPIIHMPDSRWHLGHSPMDASGLEQCAITLDEGWAIYGRPSIDPHDLQSFYLQAGNREKGLSEIRKYLWVPGGKAEPRTNFGNNGASAPFTTFSGGDAGVVTDGMYLYTADSNQTTSKLPDAQFYIYDLDGRIVSEIDLTSWWSSQDDIEAGGQMNGGPSILKERNGKVLLSSNSSCVKQLVDPVGYLESNSVSDFFVWSNLNGDYIADLNYEETAAQPWTCNDYNVGPYMYGATMDDLFFLQYSAYDAGAVSFSLMGPDGTGLGYYWFAGETAGFKGGTMVVDNGSAYDGIYRDSWRFYSWMKTSNYGDPSFRDKSVYFIGHDVIKGVITSNPDTAAEKEKPAPFTLSQNTPNPFNPVTSIPFTLEENSHVTLTVFNIAGKKVAELADNIFLAGEHSVEWNAGRFSSGVYFYKLEAGEFVETKKMMLIR